MAIVTAAVQWSTRGRGLTPMDTCETASKKLHDPLIFDTLLIISLTGHCEVQLQLDLLEYLVVPLGYSDQLA